MTELLLIVLPLILFFVAQVTIKKEIPVTCVAIILSTFVIWQTGEVGLVLFFVGLMVGLIIEVLLGLVLRTQHWKNASLFGVPYWLPIAWGYGFVVIHQIGEVVSRLVESSI